MSSHRFAGSGLPARCDVVLIGGGILGLASAYELDRRGASVVLLERDRFGAAQSGRNLGFVRQQGRAAAELPLMMAANQRWRHLSEELEADLEWQMGGNLRLTDDPEQAVRYEDWAKQAADRGLDTRVVNDQEIRSILSATAGDWLLGIFTASDGHANPVATCQAYERALRSRGVPLVEGVAAKAILTSGGRVTGVRTAIGEIVAPCVVLAAGSFSAKLARAVGVEIPQRFVRQTVVLTEPVLPLTRTAAWTGDLFIRQDKSGSLRLAAATRNEVVLDASSLRHTRLFLQSYLANRKQLRVRVDPKSLARAATRLLGSAGGDVAAPAPDGDDVAFCLQRIRRYFPDLPDLRVLRAWAGEIDATPDALPVLEVSSAPSGLVVATGMSGHGFGVAPVVGEVVAALVNGEDVPFDLKPFRSSRFTDGSILEPAHLL
ncbi:MAG TPA: FAD-binding oxidoreductase [Acidimicrobiales bacterium]|nr:FAD-binding oxidoreductase [Acidimicrobiales bacterium]